MKTTSFITLQKTKRELILYQSSILNDKAKIKSNLTFSIKKPRQKVYFISRTKKKYLLATIKRLITLQKIKTKNLSYMQSLERIFINYNRKTYHSRKNQDKEYILYQELKKDIY